MREDRNTMDWKNEMRAHYAMWTDTVTRMLDMYSEAFKRTDELIHRLEGEVASLNSDLEHARGTIGSLEQTIESLNAARDAK